jgi:hypothetical protein|nr:MAG TPA: Head Tail Connector Protein [Caudoviricetes sp.]
MAYTDYAFYTNEYYGDVVPETDFPKYADRASDRVDEITFDRLADGLSSDSRANKKVQKAVCSVAEALYQIDSVKNALLNNLGTVETEDGKVTGKTVSSVTAGSESITYSTGMSDASKTVYAQAAMDKKVENILIRQSAGQYLYGVKDDKGEYLLYAGI